MATRAIAHLRVSTNKQEDEGVSLDEQRAKVHAYAALYGVDVVDVVAEVSSAKSVSRPKLRAALARLGTDAGALLVVKLDRLTRSVRDLGDLVERHFAPDGAALLSVRNWFLARRSRVPSAGR